MNAVQGFHTDLKDERIQLHHHSSDKHGSPQHFVTALEILNPNQSIRVMQLYLVYSIR
jgi:hypothetical protein